MKVRSTLISILASLLVLGSLWLQPVFAGPSNKEVFVTKLVFVGPRPKDHPITQGLILVYTEALKRLGITFEFLEVPAKRASLYANLGTVDGELTRVHNYNTRYPNLVRVEEPNHTTKFLALSSDPAISIDGWNSLKSSNFRVECIRGIKLCVDNVPKVVTPDMYSVSSNQSQAIKRLLLGRIDILIDNEHYILPFFNSEEFHTLSKGRRLHIAGVVDETSGHAWLHKKHTELTHKLAVVLREMKQEGIYQQLRGWTAKDRFHYVE